MGVGTGMLLTRLAPDGSSVVGCLPATNPDFLMCVLDMSTVLELFVMDTTN